ncbi:MAG: hypothetical protein ABJC09_09275 [Terriglobia bacterium]
MICALPFLILTPPLPLTTPTAEEIMCRVAENQQRAEVARSKFVYDMNVFVRLQRANGKVAREESRDYVVTPTPKGARRKLIKLEGKIFQGKTEVPYTKAGFEHKGVDIDSGITDGFANSVMWRKNSMAAGLGWFPLTGGNQSRYEFKLEGEELYHDYDVYKISFQEMKSGDQDDCWSGETLIERHEFQPVLIRTSWDCKIPRAVKIMLGFTISQIGAKVTYQRFDKDVWFPVQSGGELKVRALFLYARTIAFSAKNGGFRKADVNTAIVFEGDADAPGDLADDPH